MCRFCEKYEYNADVIGLFTSEKQAVQKLLKKLIETRRIVAAGYAPGLKEVDEDDEEAVFDSLSKKCNSTKSLIAIVNKYNDSYCKDGWNFVIKQMKVE